MHAVEETSPTNRKDLMNFVFANHSKETAISPLTVREIAKLKLTIKGLKNSHCSRNTNHSLLKTFKFSA